MTATRVSEVRRLKGLKNISWLTTRQLNKVAGALSVNLIEKRGQISDERDNSGCCYILLSGVARITCRNRKGRRAVVIMLAPGMIPSFPLPVAGIKYNFRCEAVTNCQIGTIDWGVFVEICLGIGSADFKRLAANYVGRWDLVQLRCSNFMGCSLAERLALILLELSETFGVRDAEGMRLTVPARHKDLAELVGASRPRVSEHLIEFEQKHLIMRRKRQLIVKRDRLEDFLSASHSQPKNDSWASDGLADSFSRSSGKSGLANA
ncbi:MAG TPA: Crp/Fnr family transcriptional regulator [Candidatus Binataceae bacterium]|nr:Crp/Fnr family transcriptional regulator [Candidatus Binataceae bacterium]